MYWHWVILKSQSSQVVGLQARKKKKKKKKKRKEKRNRAAKNSSCVLANISVLKIDL